LSVTDTNQKRTTARSGTRGPHAERTAAMRQKLIEAAIQCLGKFGYGRTTLQRITDEADVSRGAFLHHFPTRANLMVAVAEYAAKAQTRYVRQGLPENSTPETRYHDITQATWHAMLQPTGLALLEILLGSRSDPEIGEDFREVVQNLEAFQRNDVWQVAQSLGIEDRQAVYTMVHLHQAAMRGLVLEYIYTGDLKPAERSVELLKSYKADLTAKLLGRRG